MKSYEQLARDGYAAFCKQAQRVDAAATHAPSWEQLDEGTRQCWIAAAKQIVAEMALVH